ncbi:MAG: exodeoxyribonuclease V subunit alpha [Fibrobacteria bacterium]|nr:exodeoxyribonuclease V subunit alpha [Fibrobacteria bacterium]
MPITPDISNLRALGAVPANGDDFISDCLEHSDLDFADYQVIRDLAELCDSTDTLPIYGLLAALFQYMADGSICLPADPEKWERIAWLPPKAGLTEKTTAAAIKSLTKAGLLEQTGPGEHDSLPVAPLVLRDSEQGQYLYFNKCYHAEIHLREHLLLFLDNPEPQLFNGSTDKEITAAIRDVSSRLEHTPDPWQLAAVTAALYKNFTIISGGPGTGKTSTAAIILRSMIRLGLSPERILLTAPTGRAAQRLKESIRNELQKKEQSPEDEALLHSLESSTIHRALKFSPWHNRFFYNKNRRLPARLILVDEVSMVDVFMMGKLLEAAGNNARVIFLGDRFQLPSVDVGAVLEDLIPAGHKPAFSQGFTKLYNDIAGACGLDKDKAELPVETKNPGIRQDRIVILQTSFRSVKEILELASAVNQGDITHSHLEQLQAVPGTPVPWPEPKSNPPACILEPVTSHKHWQEQLCDWAEQRLGAEKKDSTYRKRVNGFGEAGDDSKKECLKGVFTHLASAQILTLVHSGAEGERFINRTIGRYLRELLDRRSPGEHIYNGSFIIITANDYNNNLFNGDTGVILKRNGEYRAWFASEGDYRDFAISSLASWAPAWAITVHKSQGSEYGNVLMVLPVKEEHRMLTREIIYTGATRAKSTLVIRGSRKVLEIAAARAINRESGIELW